MGSAWAFPARIAAAWLLAVAGCAAPGTGGAAALDDLIAFSDPAMCRATPATVALLGKMIGGSGDTLRDDWILAGTIPAEHADRLGPVTMTRREGWRSVRTSVRGTLWDLPLVAIHQNFPEGGDPGGFTFEFGAPVEAVERAARARGFVARAGRSVQMGPPDGLSYEIDLNPAPDDARRSLLGCGYA